MYNKKGFEFSFGFIFSIIVGAVILFIAIYGVSELSNTAKFAQDSEAGNKLGAILTPLETGFEDNKISVVNLNQESRIFNSCNAKGNFGKQGISISTKTTNNKWGDPGVENNFFNKYIFSEKIIEGKKLMVLSKELNFPFKVADVMIIWEEEDRYCFINPPRTIEEDIDRLKPSGINTTSSILNCMPESKKICFGQGIIGCDTIISVESRITERNGKILNFLDDENNVLLYGSIFSDPEIFECQQERLLKRSSELSLIYLEKSNFLESRGCSFATLRGNLLEFVDLTIVENKDFNLVNRNVLDLRRANDKLECKLF